MKKTEQSEAEFLKSYTPNEYDQVLFSIDPVVLTLIDDRLHVLLVKRSIHPYKGLWSLPGGRVDQHHCEDIQSAVRQKLKAKTGLDQPYFEQVFTDGGLHMDPRGWTVTTVYMALVRYEDVELCDNETGEEVMWHPTDALTELLPMAFWHVKLVGSVLDRLKDKINYTDLPIIFMPDTFTIRKLRMAYEAILDAPITRQNFIKRSDKLKKLGLIVEAGLGDETESAGRPARRYRYVPDDGPHVFSHSMTTVGNKGK